MDGRDPNSQTQIQWCEQIHNIRLCHSALYTKEDMGSSIYGQYKIDAVASS